MYSNQGNTAGRLRGDVSRASIGARSAYSFLKRLVTRGSSRGCGAAPPWILAPTGVQPGDQAGEIRGMPMFGHASPAEPEGPQSFA